MTTRDSIDSSAFSYSLPVERIARHPLERRDQSKLLVYREGEIAQDTFSRLPGYLPKDSWLVFNDTRVIQARLSFRKESGARIEIFCLEPFSPSGYEESLAREETCVWRCLVGNARKWKGGRLLLDVGGAHSGNSGFAVEAWLEERTGTEFLIRFRWSAADWSFARILEEFGKTPIPPYLNREAEVDDRTRYQTVYGQLDGSVAAPTAGLHFTPEMLRELEERDMPVSRLTLHVGAGTFIPVKEGNARDHAMHAELVLVGLEFLEKWRNDPRKLIAVGTTSTRSLESLYWLGVKMLRNQPEPGNVRIDQWENEELPQNHTLEESLTSLVAYMKEQGLHTLRFHTRLMIVPGYRFRCIRGLLTNFHMPSSTLLLLIAALLGDDWRRVYDHALSHGFRFLSYGDSSLLLP
ncbi:MAG: S-adenosylmethionine:tRNA ribosyltransferase-isomerase [Bacteroidales bacterium]